MSEDANGFLMAAGGGPQAISFKDPAMKGKWVGGRVLKTPGKDDISQESQPNGTLRFFDNGDPVMQVAIRLQAATPSGDDDGVRRLFVRSIDRKALKEAVEEAGAKGVYEGGELYCMWYDDKPSATKGNNDMKLKKFAYKPPTANDVLMGDSPFAQPAAAATTLPAPLTGNEPVGTQVTVGGIPFTKISDNPFPPAPVTASAPVPQMTPAQYANPLGDLPPAPAGMDPSQWAAATPEQRAGVLALMGLSAPAMPY